MKFAAAAILSFAAFALPAVAQDAAKPAATTLGAADTAARAAATRAASEFLALLDAGKFAESWTGGAVLLRGAVPQDQWSGVLASMRAALGEVTSRKLVSSTFTRSLPGAPAGDYLVVEYQTEFAKKAGTMETVTPMREPDGSWKVSGYFVK